MPRPKRKTSAKKKTARKTAKRKPAKRATRATTKKRTTKKRTTAKRRTTAKKTSPVRKTSVVRGKAYSKSQILTELAEDTGLSKKEIQMVFEAHANLIARHIDKKGVGTYTIPGLAKIVVVKKPATKARKGINPFTGEEMMFKAKPARNVVKVRPLKNLKEMAA